MAQDLTSNSVSIFDSMSSILNPHVLQPLSCFYLPYPVEIVVQENQKFPNVFLQGNKRRKEITACPHTARKHYAKSMCNNCYHRIGRSRNAWECPHTDKKLYAKGKCQHCYVQEYNREKGLE